MIEQRTPPQAVRARLGAPTMRENHVWRDCMENGTADVEVELLIYYY